MGLSRGAEQLRWPALWTHRSGSCCLFCAWFTDVLRSSWTLGFSAGRHPFWTFSLRTVSRKPGLGEVPVEGDAELTN